MLIWTLWLATFFCHRPHCLIYIRVIAYCCDPDSKLGEGQDLQSQLSMQSGPKYAQRVREGWVGVESSVDVLCCNALQHFHIPKPATSQLPIWHFFCKPDLYCSLLNFMFSGSDKNVSSRNRTLLQVDWGQFITIEKKKYLLWFKCSLLIIQFNSIHLFHFTQGITNVLFIIM